MVRYIAQRLGTAVLALLAVACLAVVLTRSAPGDPWLDVKHNSGQREAVLDARYGLDRPLPAQVGSYLWDLLHLDLGVSLKLRQGTAVNTLIAESFPVSARLGLFALGWAVLAGVPLGCLAACRRGRAFDKGFRVMCALGGCLPSFAVAALLLCALCGGILTVFPAAFDGSAKSYVLPCFALGLYPMCTLARQTRAAVLENLQTDFLRSARARGLSRRRLVFGHALRCALPPLLALLAPMLAFALCGSFVVEQVFSIPGLGSVLVRAVESRDYPVITGVTVFLAALVIGCNLAGDLLSRAADPRVRLGEEGQAYGGAL